METTISGGKLVFHGFGSLAAFERHLIRERTNAGLAAAGAGTTWEATEEARRSQETRVGATAL